MSALTQPIVFRAGRDLDALLRETAKRRGVTLSALIRRAIANGLKFEEPIGS